MKVSKAAYIEFQQAYLLDAIKVPSYRYGQAFLNTFPEIDNYLQSSGDDGISESAAIWSLRDTAKVKNLIEVKYVENKNETI